MNDAADRIRYAELARITALAADLSRRYLDGAPRPRLERAAWFVAPD